jgi:hypothetical protein
VIDALARRAYGPFMRHRDRSLWRAWRERKQGPYERAQAEYLRQLKEHGRLINRAETVHAESRRDAWMRFGA